VNAYLGMDALCEIFHFMGRVFQYPRQEVRDPVLQAEIGMPALQVIHLRPDVFALFFEAATLRVSSCPAP